MKNNYEKHEPVGLRQLTWKQTMSDPLRVLDNIDSKLNNVPWEKFIWIWLGICVAQPVLVASTTKVGQQRSTSMEIILLENE